MTVRTVCTYVHSGGKGCGQRPPVAEYFLVDALRGERLIASLCAQHDTDDAQKAAKRDGLERRT